MSVLAWVLVLAIGAIVGYGVALSYYNDRRVTLLLDVVRRLSMEQRLNEIGYYGVADLESRIGGLVRGENEQ